MIGAKYFLGKISKKTTIIGISVLLVTITGTLITMGLLGYIPDWMNQQDDTIEVIDMFGRTISVKSEPDRIIGTGAGALRYLVYLNATDCICGVENIELDEQIAFDMDLRPYNLAHGELRQLTSIGPMWGGDAELIVAADPQVVFTTNYKQSSDLDSLQQRIGIPVVGLIYGDLGDNLDVLWDGLNLTANILGKSDRFNELKTYILGLLNDLDTRTYDIEESEKPGCYIGGVAYKGAHGITSTKPGYDSFDFINVNNVAGELTVDHAYIDKEQIITWNPDIIFIDGGGFSLSKSDLDSGDYDTCQAIIDNDVYILLPYNWYSANFANILINTYYIGSVIYPTRFSDVNITSIAAEIYTGFVGEDVFQTMMLNFKNSAGTTQDALAQLGGLFES